jgi:hypothetical protein
MKFTVTSKVGVNEVVDRSNSARAALEQVLAILGRKRNNVRIFDEDGSRRTPAELCLLAAREGLAIDELNGDPVPPPQVEPRGHAWSFLQARHGPRERRLLASTE